MLGNVPVMLLLSIATSCTGQMGLTRMTLHPGARMQRSQVGHSQAAALAKAGRSSCWRAQLPTCKRPWLYSTDPGSSRACRLAVMGRTYPGMYELMGGSVP